MAPTSPRHTLESSTPAKYEVENKDLNDNWAHMDRFVWVHRFKKRKKVVFAWQIWDVLLQFQIISSKLSLKTCNITCAKKKSFRVSFWILPPVTITLSGKPHPEEDLQQIQTLCWVSPQPAYSIRSFYSQLSISRVQFCSSSGYLLRSIMHAAVVVILNKETQERTQERIN